MSHNSLIEAMKAKDSKLYDEVCLLPIWAAWRKWIETYPEDFPLRGMDAANATAIKAKAEVNG